MLTGSHMLDPRLVSSRTISVRRLMILQISLKCYLTHQQCCDLFNLRIVFLYFLYFFNNFSFHFNSGFCVFVMCFCNFYDILDFYLALFTSLFIVVILAELKIYFQLVHISIHNSVLADLLRWCLVRTETGSCLRPSLIGRGTKTLLVSFSPLYEIITTKYFAVMVRRKILNQ